MGVVLYRPSLDARSGAGQLLELQYRGLQGLGVPVLLACDRGAFKFWLRTGVRAHKRSIPRLMQLQKKGVTVLDHGLSLPSAHLVFVHNLETEVMRHLPSRDGTEIVRHEREFFESLESSTIVVANSKLVAEALHVHFGIDRERITVLYPAYRSSRYSPERTAQLRAAARAALGIDARHALVGFVTSGDFQKRGLDLFFESAARIAAERRDARFLVVGSKKLPAEMQEHALVRRGLLQHRPKCRRPERWFAGLDLFLYPARFEEFGMVIAEAQAMGVPVLTSRVVGASECLPEAYEPWLLREPAPADMADRALELLADEGTRQQLAATAAKSVRRFDETGYVKGTCRLIADQSRRLK